MKVRFIKQAGTSERLILANTPAEVVEDGEPPAVYKDDKGKWQLRVMVVNGIFTDHDHADSGEVQVDADSLEFVEE